MYVQSFNTIKENCRSSQYKIISSLYTDRHTDGYTEGRTDTWTDRLIPPKNIRSAVV